MNFQKFLHCLSQLKNEYGISISDSLHKGVGLLFLTKRQNEKGLRLAFIDKDDNVMVEVEDV